MTRDTASIQLKSEQPPTPAPTLTLALTLTLTLNPCPYSPDPNSNSDPSPNPQPSPEPNPRLWKEPSRPKASRLWCCAVISRSRAQKAGLRACTRVESRRVSRWGSGWVRRCVNRPARAVLRGLKLG